MFKRSFSLLLVLILCLSAFGALTALAENEEDAGFTVTFAGDEGVASITVYETQNYTGTSISLARDGTTCSRNSDTGAPDSSGSGQLNFTVVVAEGYALVGVSATSGTYKNIKGPEDTGLPNTYRITKITADTTVTVTTVACGHDNVADGSTPTWAWSDDCGWATLSYVCANCRQNVKIYGNISSELTDASTVSFRAYAFIGEIMYNDVKTDAPFTATFVCDDGVESINVFYTQNYEADPDETNASTAVARDSSTGYPVITGDGQISFEIVLKADCKIAGVSATAGTYKNIKDPSETGAENIYRITKIEDDTTVTITTASCAHGVIAAGTEPAWSWSDDRGTATLSYVCADCGNTVGVAGNVTSVLLNDTSVAFTAVAAIGENEFSDTVEAAPFTAIFSCDAGVERIDVYYTQDYAEADEENAAFAVARDGSTGYPVITGDGQINFTVVLKDGYTIDALEATEGAYKNLKGPDDTGKENTYRITKVKGDMTVTVTTTAPAQALWGDVNNDGKINKKDSLDMKKYLADSSYTIDLAAADVNLDGAVNKKDSLRLKQWLAGWDVRLGDTEPTFGGQAWLDWLVNASWLSDDPAYKHCLGGIQYTPAHQNAEMGSPFEVWHDQYLFLYTLDATEVDATENIGTQDYAYIFEIWYRDAESGGEYKRVVTSPTSAYIWGNERPDVIYRMPVYNEGMNDLTLNDGEISHEYEVIIIVYKGSVSPGCLMGWKQDWILYTDSSAMYVEEAKEAGIIS